MLSEQEQIISKMSPQKKLELSLKLYYSAKELRKAALAKDYPELSEAEIEKKVKEIFLHARS